ncbi:hypothetical protein D9M68_512860 [compost metagenome]
MNRPSKNCVAQWVLALAAGLVKVTAVLTGTRMKVGVMALTAVDSVAPGSFVGVCTRARNTVFGVGSAAPSTAWPDTGRRTTGGVGVAAAVTAPPTLKAHSRSPRGAESPYGMLVPPENTAMYCSPSIS